MVSDLSEESLVENQLSTARIAGSQRVKTAKVVLITTSQPSMNPRLVKEASALARAGYVVKVLYCYRADWALRADQVIFERVSWMHKLTGGAPKVNPQIYQWTRIRRRLAELVPAFPLALERTLCQAFDELCQEAEKEKADLYIAHNPGALAVAARVAAKTGARYVFDAEDFHTQELVEGHIKNELTGRLERKYLYSAHYISAASPLIAEAYRSLYPSLKDKVFAVNNVFPLADQPTFRPRVHSAPLRLFWFSQTLGRDRGLEDILSSLSYLVDIPIEIGLVGNASSADRTYFASFIQSAAHTIEFLPVRPEKQLIELAATYDIGLALERDKPLNRDLCLTNKIFTYALVGNAIIASSTRAQSLFMQENEGIGHCYPLYDSKSIAAIIRKYWEQPALLESQRYNAWRLAQEKYNWELEQEKVLLAVRNIWKA